MKRFFIIGLIVLVLLFGFAGICTAAPDSNGGPKAHTMLHLKQTAATSGPTGLSPTQIRGAYNLPTTGGTGTIAIIDAYDNPNVAADLTVFSNTFGLPTPSFEKHMMASTIRANSGWGLEISLDVQWAHAIAPNAKILLVEAKSNSLADLLAAVDYARGRSDVVAISMSWGANEFSGETLYDFHFTSSYGATFFASSGDAGAGITWPAASPNVVAVGGTTLKLNPNGSVASETGWSGSGGGVSSIEVEPAYQSTYGIPGANNHRCVPDVSYDADPYTGVSVYDSYGYGGWLVVGGTSAGAPQWAAIQSLGNSATNSNFYKDANANYASYFRDITIGSNGYPAATGYDYVTGLGSPLTTNYAPVTTPDFSISASPSSITANRGASPTSTITVTSLSGFSDVVNLATSVPAGWGASLSPASVTPSAGGSASSTLTVNVPLMAAAGTYSVTVTGTTSGSLTHSTSLTVTVVVPDFSIKASPSARTISGRGSTTYTVTLTALNGYNSSVSLSVKGLPSGATASFSPSSITPTPTGASSTLKVTINQRHRGTYTLTITATGGSLSHSTSVTLTNR
jgi:subtilase family serine protease